MAIISTEDSAATRIRANKAVGSESAGGVLFAAVDPGCTRRSRPPSQTTPTSRWPSLQARL